MRDFGYSFVLLFGFSLCLFCLTMSGHLCSQDEEILFRSTVSYCTGQGGAIPPLSGTTVFGTVDRSWGSRRGNDGRQYPQYGIGQPLLATPLYLLAQRMIRSQVTVPLGVFGFVYPPFQYHENNSAEFTSRFLVVFFNQIISSLSVAVVGLFCFRVFGSLRLGIFLGILYAVGTIVWVYSRTFFTEPLAGLCVLASFFLVFRTVTLWDRGDPASRSRAVLLAALAGLSFGYGLLTRLDTLFFFPGLGTMISWPSWPPLSNTGRQRTGNPDGLLVKWPIFLAFGAVTAVFVGVLAWLNYSRFGSVLATGYSDQPEGIRFLIPVEGLGGFLFTPGKSIFLYSPILILGVAALPTFYREERRLAAGILLGTGAFLLFESSWQNWDGGWCWGPRHVIQLTPLLLLPAGAVLMPRVEERPGWVLPLLLICLLIAIPIQFLGISADFIKVLHNYAVKQGGNLYPTIYSLSDSSPLLHLRYLYHQSHDLFWPRFASGTPGVMSVLPLIPLVGLLLFSVLICRVVKRENSRP
jgi:hypothetical protein